MLLLPDATTGKDGWPTALHSVPWYAAGTWLLIRLMGYVVLAPLAEELAFRGFLLRRLIHADFHDVPIGRFSWLSFVASSLLFGALHGRLWFAATVAGMLFALALYRRRSFGDAVLAHATTNGLIALYVFVTGRWSVWS
jgi:CAAX prenyl protease-like protein